MEGVADVVYKLPDTPIVHGVAAMFNVSVSEQLAAKFSQITGIPFQTALNLLKRHFPEIDHNWAARFTAAFFKVLFFDDPNLIVKDVRGYVVFRGKKYTVTDPGIVLLETLANSAIPPSITVKKLMAFEPKDDLTATLKEHLIAAYVFTHYETLKDLDEPNEDWQEVLFEIFPKPADLSNYVETKRYAFEEAKDILKYQNLATLNVSSALEFLYSIAKAENFVAATARTAATLTDGDNYYTPEDFAPADHEHEEYLPKDGIAANALYLVENGKRYTPEDFAPADHEHEEYVKPEEINNADYLILPDGTRLTPNDLAFAGHMHSEYLRKDEPAFAAKAFTDGKNVYYLDYFAPKNHAEDPDYLAKNPYHDYLKKSDVAINTKLLQGHVLEEFALVGHQHPEFMTIAEADEIFRPIDEDTSLVDEVKGFVIQWF